MDSKSEIFPRAILAAQRKLVPISPSKEIGTSFFNFLTYPNTAQSSDQNWYLPVPQYYETIRHQR
jgi:hypothetical protein